MDRGHNGSRRHECRYSSSNGGHKRRWRKRNGFDEGQERKISRTPVLKITIIRVNRSFNAKYSKVPRTPIFHIIWTKGRVNKLIPICRRSRLLNWNRGRGLNRNRNRYRRSNRNRNRRLSLS